MTDLHTHILPGMDDGAPDGDTALQMLHMEAEQGVETVALTPHFYRSREYISDFLTRRDAAMEQLKNAAKGQEGLPRLILGAEVSYVPGIADWPELERLCYEGTRTLLVELPMEPWNDEVFRQLYRLEGYSGITPMIAHAERYFVCQERKHMNRLLEMDLPLQVSAEALLHLAGRRKALLLLQNHNGLLISDCHNLTTRRPNMGQGLDWLEKKLGRESAARIAADTDEILLE